MRVAVLLAEGVEDLEYWVTLMRLREAGAVVTSAGTTTEPIAGKHGLEARADCLAEELDPAKVDALAPSRRGSAIWTANPGRSST